jgi:hypothetical protein
MTPANLPFLFTIADSVGSFFDDAKYADGGTTMTEEILDGELLDGE